MSWPQHYVAPGYVGAGYSQVGVTIDWGTRVIFVPRFFLTYVGGTTYQLDTNTFRNALKDLEDNEAGAVFPVTHRHNTIVTLSGVTYARVIEIINGYTITFEDGQYSVNLVGSNNNIPDVLNLNQVSVRAANSAGLTNSTAPGDLADAVWNHATGAAVAVRLAEAWGRLGLDPTKPLVTGQTEISFGDIVMALTEVGTTVTVSRQ